MSLLLALDALTAMTLAFIVVVIVISFLSASRVQVSRFLVVVGKLADLFSSHVLVSWLLGSKCGLNLSNRVLWHLFGEFDLEDNVQVTEVVSLLVEGKTLFLDSFDILGLNDFAWVVFDSDLSTVEVIKNEINSSQSLKEGD